MVKIEERLCDLVDDELLVLLVELSSLPILPDQSMQINVHMLEYQIDVFIIFCTDHLLQAYYIVLL